jgi:hypothetical protein
MKVIGEVRRQKEGNAAKRGSDRFSLPLTISSDYPMVEMVNPPVHHLLYCNKWNTRRVALGNGVTFPESP